MFTLNEVLRAITGKPINTQDRFFSEATVDSRQAIRGAMFVAMEGENTDGHQFIPQAFKKGALIALVQKDCAEQFTSIDLRKEAADAFQPDQIPSFPFCIRVDNTLKALQDIAAYHRNQIDLKVIGITGTVGKSTTKELVAEVLSQRYHTLKNTGNLNNEIGLPLTLLRAGKGHQRAVLEMGFYVPGEIDLLCQIAKPEIGVITNIGTVHAERAGSIDVIAKGKSELIRSLPPNGYAILNYDDPLVKPMAELTEAKSFYYGLNPDATIWADQIESFGLEGIRFCLHYKNESYYLRIPLIGRHSVHTALRAAAVGRVEGLNWSEIFKGLNHAQSQLRMAVIHSEDGALIIDDTYNASPDSTMAALNLLHEMSGYKLAILGEMRELGQYEIHGHTIVGARAAEVCDELITVGIKARILAESAYKTGLASSKIHWFETVPEVIDFLKIRKLKEGEVVLIKGSRGLQMERIVDVMETKQ